MCHRWQTSAVWAFLVMLALGTMGCVQVSERDLKREIEILKKNQEEIRKELEGLKALIRDPQRPGNSGVRDIEFDLGNNPIRGDSAALLTLVEFTDYQ